MPIIRTSYSGLPAGNAWTTGPDGINKSAVIVSFAAAPSTVLAGTDDTALSRFFDTAPSGHRIYYAYYSEPETNVSRHQFTTSVYRRAWRHIAALARKSGNHELTPTLILRASDLSAHSGAKWQSYLPGQHIIRTIAWDAYPAGTLTGHDPQPTPPATFMGPAVAAAKSAGLKFGFAGFALATATGRPTWLKTVADYLMSKGALFGVLTSRTAVPATELTDRPSIKAWHAVVGRSGTDQPIPTGPAPVPPGPTSSAPAPSSPAPNTSPITPSPSPTTTSPSASPPPTGGSSAWFTAGGTVPSGNLQLDYRDNVWSGDAAKVGYTYTDLSSSPAHSTLGNFSTKLNANPSNGEVVAGPDLQGVTYSAIPASLKSSFAVTPPANNTGLDYEYNYDIWLTTAAKATAFDWSSDLELMIWTDTVRQTPAGSKVGTLPDGSAVWVAGNNVDGTVSIVLPQNQTSGTVDITALVSELKAKGYVTSADNGILDVEYGIECPYGGGNTFSVDQFSVTGTPNPAQTGSGWVGAP